MLTRNILLDILDTYESPNPIINFGHGLFRLIDSDLLLPPEIADLKSLIMQFPDEELSQDNRLHLKNHIENLPESHYKNKTSIRKIYQAIKDKLKESEKTPEQYSIHSMLNAINFHLLSGSQYSIVRIAEIIACFEELTGLKIQHHILNSTYQHTLEAILLGLLISVKREDILAYLLAKCIVQPLGHGAIDYIKTSTDDASYAAYSEPAINLILPALFDYVLGFENSLFFGAFGGFLFQSVTTHMTTAFFEYASEWSSQYPNTKKLIESSTKDISYYLGMLSGFSLYNYANSYSWKTTENHDEPFSGQKTKSTNHTSSGENTKHEKPSKDSSSQKSNKCHTIIPVKLTNQEISELQSKSCGTITCMETAYKALGLNPKGSYSKTDIKKAFQCRLLVFHPDKCTYTKEICTEQAAIITNARNILKANSKT